MGSAILTASGLLIGFAVFCFSWAAGEWWDERHGR